MSHNQVTGFPDTFFGPNDKSYIDRINKDVTRLRGVDCLYYPLLDQTRRIDSDRPVIYKPTLDVFDRKRHSGDPLYGEPSIVRDRLSSVKRSVEPDWAYGDPITIRGIAMDPSSDEQQDERGTMYNRGLMFDLARIVAEEEGIASYLAKPIRPRQGDVIQFTSQLDGFFEAEDVSRDESRFGGTGFFAVYKITLYQTSKYIASRKVLPSPGAVVPEDVA